MKPTIRRTIKTGERFPLADEVVRWRKSFAMLESLRRIWVADDIGIEIHDRNNDAVFDFEIAELMQVRLPATVLRKIIGHAFGKENVTGITAIHHPLRDVDAGAGDVLALVHIGHVMDRAAVNSHAHGQTRLCTQPLTDLERALHRIFDGAGEDQRHAVTCRKKDELARRLRCAHRVRLMHNLVQLLQRFRLLVDQQLRVTDDVHEEDMGNLEAQLRLLLVRHLRRELRRGAQSSLHQFSRARGTNIFGNRRKQS